MDEPMTLTERLANPQRRAPKDTDLVILDTVRTEADMREAAHAMNGETVLRRALISEIKRLSTTLAEANEICRSANEIAKRDGAETNWEAFRNRLKVALLNQHSIMYPTPDEPKEHPPGHPIIRAPDTRPPQSFPHGEAQ